MSFIRQSSVTAGLGCVGVHVFERTQRRTLSLVPNTARARPPVPRPSHEQGVYKKGRRHVRFRLAPGSNPQLASLGYPPPKPKPAKGAPVQRLRQGNRGRAAPDEDNT